MGGPRTACVGPRSLSDQGSKTLAATARDRAHGISGTGSAEAPVLGVVPRPTVAQAQHPPVVAGATRAADEPEVEQDERQRKFALSPRSASVSGRLCWFAVWGQCRVSGSGGVTCGAGCVVSWR